MNAQILQYKDIENLMNCRSVVFSVRFFSFASFHLAIVEFASSGKKCRRWKYQLRNE